jgi:hypothetical protein
MGLAVLVIEMEVTMQKVIGQAQKNITKDGDMSPVFVIVDHDNNAVIYEAGWEDNSGKEEVHNWLKRTVEQLGSVRYYYVGTGWSVSDENVRARFDEAKCRMRTAPGEDAMKEFLGECFKMLMFPPSENPAKCEELIVSEFEKGVGTKTVNLEIIRNADAVSFGPPRVITDVARSYNLWNIWCPVQITLGGDDDGETETT